MPSVPTNKPSSTRSRRTGRGGAPVTHARGQRVEPPSEAPFEQDAAAVLSELQHALSDMFAAAPEPIEKIVDVEQSLGVNYLLAWQLYRIVNANNPLAAGMHVPSQVSVKKLLTAAARRGVSSSIIDRVSGAFSAFEQLVRSEAGDRDEMEAMLSAFLPEERPKQDLASRQAAFRGMSQIKGVVAESITATFLMRPSTDGRMLDRVIIACDLGVRRLRPDACIMVGSGDLSKPDSSVTTIEGAPSAAPLGSLLPRFSTTPLPRLESREVGAITSYRVAGEEVAMRSAVDLVTADRRNNAIPAYLEPGGQRYRGYAHVVTTPAKRLTVDIFAHKDAYVGVAPRLRVYDAAHRGLVNRFDDPARVDDLLVSYDEVRMLPPGLPSARLAHAPRYVELLEHVYGKLGWDPAEFRGYRLDVQFPVYSAVYMLGFEVPEAPSGG